jgi:lipopolysaccharide transport system ATP-binding protein
MLKHLSGIMEPTRGRIEVHGRLSALIEVGAGFHPDLTGRENVYLNGVILGMSRNEIRRKFDEIVEFAELADFIDTPVKRYSSGMFARLGFSVAAHLEPDILIIDEVLSVGDFAFQRKGLEKMRAVAQSGATVIFVSHNLQAVAEFCKRAILLDHGRVVADGTTDAVVRRYLDTGVDRSGTAAQGPVRIVGTTLLGAGGETSRFLAGTRARIDIDLEARERTERIAVVLDLKNTDFYEVFNTSTERLGHPPLTLAAGERARCSFEVDLHLGPGTYYLDVYLYRYDVQQIYDHVFPASSFVVAVDRDTLGAANLYPTVRSYATLPPGPAPHEVAAPVPASPSGS